MLIRRNVPCPGLVAPNAETLRGTSESSFPVAGCPGMGDTQAPSEAQAAAATDLAARRFNRSMVVSGIRCLLTYIVFPWLLPALGWAKGVGPWIGLPIGLVAIAFNVDSIRRFRASEHRLRIPVMAINVGVIALLTVLVVRDVVDLLG